jgi:hypothetical protein
VPELTDSPDLSGDGSAGLASWLRGAACARGASSIETSASGVMSSRERSAAVLTEDSALGRSSALGGGAAAAGLGSSTGFSSAAPILTGLNPIADANMPGFMGANMPPPLPPDVLPSDDAPPARRPALAVADGL